MENCRLNKTKKEIEIDRLFNYKDPIDLTIEEIEHILTQIDDKIIIVNLIRIMEHKKKYPNNQSK